MLLKGAVIAPCMYFVPGHVLMQLPYFVHFNSNTICIFLNSVLVWLGNLFMEAKVVADIVKQFNWLRSSS